MSGSLTFHFIITAMKPLKIPLFVVGMLAPFLLTAQSLHLTGSSPANHSLNVPLTTTVSFTFDYPLEPGVASLDSIGDRFLAVPVDKVTIHSLSLSADARMLHATVTHQPDADITWAFFGLRATTGQIMNDFHTVTYTTAAAWAPGSIQGRLVTPDRPAAEYYKTVVMLLTDLSFMNGSEGDGPDDEMRYAVVSDPSTGAYSFASVKPGSYYILAMSFPDLREDMEPFAYATLTDSSNEPIPIVVSDVAITGLDLQMKPMEFGEPDPADPADALDVYGLVRAHMAIHAPSAEPIVMESGMPSQVSRGEYHDWMVAYFNAADSMLFFVYANVVEVLDVEAIPFRDMQFDEPLPVPLSTIKRIPQTFVGSRAAFQTALMNGLGEQLALPFNDVQVRMALSHLYFEYPDLVTIDSNPYWAIKYKGQGWNGGVDLDFLVDAVTGAFLGKQENEVSPQNPLQVTIMEPMSGSGNVPLQTGVRFSFNDPIRPETFNMDSYTDTWIVFPRDKVTINGVFFTDNNRTVIFDVTHSGNGDYTWLLFGVRGQDGQMMSQPGLLTYTTAPGLAPYKVEGSLMWPPEMNVPDPANTTTLVMLFKSPDYFLNGMEGPPSDVAYVGTLLPEGWNFSVGRVRPGTYYPAVFVMPKPADTDGLLAVGFLPDQDGRPLPIQVGTGSITGLQLRMFNADMGGEHHPIDVSAVVDGVRAAVNAQGTGAVLLTLWGREEIQRPTLPTGMSYDWGFVFYEPDTDTVQVVQVHSGGMFAVDRFHISSIPEEERMPAELVQPLPSGFISSGHAVNTALTNGLAQLIHFAPYDAWMQVRYELNRFYFLYPGVMNADSPPFWRIQFNAERWGSGDQLLWSQEALYLVNAIDGSLIHQTLSTDLEDADAPDAIRLEQNYPNPFNPSTVIGYSVGTQDLASLPVRLTVYDVLGREVAVLVDGWMPAGRHSVTFDASDLPSGVYLYRLVAGGQTLQRKLTLIR